MALKNVLTTYPEDIGGSLIQQLREEDWIYPATANAWFVAKNGNDDNVGSSVEPFLTIGKAMSVAQNKDSIVVYNGTYAETLTLNKSVFIECGQRGEVVVDAITIDGAIFARVKGIEVTGSLTNVNNGCGAKFYGCTLGTDVTFTGVLTNDTSFVDCYSSACSYDLSHNGNTIQLIGGYLLGTVYVNCVGGVVQIADCLGVGSITHDGGYLQLLDNIVSITPDVNGKCLTSTAVEGVSNFLAIGQVNFQQADLSFGILDKSGDCAYVISACCNYSPAVSTLTGTRLTYMGGNASDLTANYPSPTNYTPLNASVSGHLKGINDAITGGGTSSLPSSIVMKRKVVDTPLKENEAVMLSETGFYGELTTTSGQDTAFQIYQALPQATASMYRDLPTNGRYLSNFVWAERCPWDETSIAVVWVSKNASTTQLIVLKLSQNMSTGLLSFVSQSVTKSESSSVFEIYSPTGAWLTSAQQFIAFATFGSATITSILAYRYTWSSFTYQDATSLTISPSRLPTYIKAASARSFARDFTYVVLTNTSGTSVRVFDQPSGWSSPLTVSSGLCTGMDIGTPVLTEDPPFTYRGILAFREIGDNKFFVRTIMPSEGTTAPYFLGYFITPDLPASGFSDSAVKMGFSSDGRKGALAMTNEVNPDGSTNNYVLTLTFDCTSPSDALDLSNFSSATTASKFYANQVTPIFTTPIGDGAYRYTVAGTMCKTGTAINNYPALYTYDTTERNTTAPAFVDAKYLTASGSSGFEGMGVTGSANARSAYIYGASNGSASMVPTKLSTIVFTSNYDVSKVIGVSATDTPVGDIGTAYQLGSFDFAGATYNTTYYLGVKGVVTSSSTDSTKTLGKGVGGDQIMIRPTTFMGW